MVLNDVAHRKSGLEIDHKTFIINSLHTNTFIGCFLFHPFIFSLKASIIMDISKDTMALSCFLRMNFGVDTLP